MPSSDPENRSDKFYTKEINLAVINPGGLNGKTDSINNFIHKFDIRICIISETHTAGKEKPFLNSQMTTFFRNRSTKQNKGGIAIAVEKSIAESCVLLAKGKTNLEWLAVKVNTFSPPLVIIATYGCQSSRTKTADSFDKWKEVFDFANDYSSDNHVLICGDMNAAIANNLGVQNNDPSTNNNGRNIIKIIENDPKWEVVNKLNRDNNRSHVNRSSDSTRCLDYIITNKITKHTRFYCDNQYQCTPYRVTQDNLTNSIENRVYSDHKTLISTFRVNDKRPEDIKLPPLVIKNEEGWAKWYDMTHDLACDIVIRINKGQTGAKIMNFINRKMKDIENKAFLKIKQNKIKRKLKSDNEMFLNLTSELQKMEDEVSNMKDTNKIFRARKNKLLSERGEELFSIFNSDGKLMETKEEILEALSEYNENLLSRKEHDDNWKELFQMKKELTDNLTETEIKTFNTLTHEEFLKAIDKIRKKDKQLFKPFLKASPTFQASFFYVIKAIYEEELMPGDFNETELYPLFKKGDQRDPSMYRYLHMKNMPARLFEATIYVKIESHLDTHTPHIQLGGMKQGDCLEHLCTIASMMEDAEKNKRAFAALFCDVKKMFDRVHLADTQSTLIRQGADLKALKVLHKLQNKNILKVKGSDKSFIIQGGEGQGNCISGRRVALGLAEATTRHLRTAPKEIIYKHHNITIQTTGFIDDAALYSNTATGAKTNGNIYTNILDEMALEAHPTKTVQVIIGDKDAVQKLADEITNNPTIVQGHLVQTAPFERYLGQIVPQGGRRQYIEHNLADKMQKVLMVSTQIRNVLKMPVMARFGKILAQKTLLVSQIIPVITYGSQSWLSLTKSHCAQLEQILKKALEVILSLPPNTTYESMLHQMGIYHITNVIHALKLKYFQNKLHVKKRGVLFDILRYEYCHGIKTGFSSEIKQLCDLYNLPDINVQYVQTEQITNACKEASMKLQWTVINAARHLPMSVTNFTTIKSRPYFKLDTMKSRALLAFYTGNLILRRNKSFQMKEKHQNSKLCLFFPNCNEVENWSHFVECRMYKTRYIDLGYDELSLATFLVSRNAERIAQFGENLFLTADHQEAMYHDIFDGITDTTKPKILLEMLAKNYNSKQNIKTKHRFNFTKLKTLKMLTHEKLSYFPGGEDLIREKISSLCPHKQSITVKRKREEIVAMGAKTTKVWAEMFITTSNLTLINNERKMRTSKKLWGKFIPNLSLRAKIHIQPVSQSVNISESHITTLEMNNTTKIDEHVITASANGGSYKSYKTEEILANGSIKVTEVTIEQDYSVELTTKKTVKETISGISGASNHPPQDPPAPSPEEDIRTHEESVEVASDKKPEMSPTREPSVKADVEAMESGKNAKVTDIEAKNDSVNVMIKQNFLI